MSKGRPIAKKRAGNIILTLWENEWDGKTYYSYSLQKSYKDKQSGKWVNTDSLPFSKSDLSNISTLVQETMFANVKKEVVEQKNSNQQSWPNISDNAGSMSGGIEQTFQQPPDDNDIPF